jgi:hypothetical protein
MKINHGIAKQKKRTKVPIEVLLVVFVILLVLVGSQLMAMRAQNRPDKNKVDESYPIVEYNASLPAEAEARSKRERANRSYDRNTVVTKSPVGTEVLIMNDFWNSLPALPVYGSNAIVMGSVVEAQAFLSNDKTGAYSEFTIQIEKVFKDDKDAPLSFGSIVKVDRLGARVRHSADRTVWYHVPGLSMPQLGKKYVLFLRRNANTENYLILTAYEIRSGRVYALDGTQGSSSFASAAYENVEEEVFLSKLHEAIGIAMSSGKP